ncbi:helix-turn-helix transcriptional regulator [Bradyrhizobium lablabi]|uniref:helix-turn-helix domain-containing protein n=1 Tax=Bradyrhizobium lablabi TaxID=722472 RepID=UPI001BA9531F|nr:AraC family transcriptional regulator [Bradyrhizobium lablabi]MBR1119944.1 helix-turn-helix transcriptional regulator [Bradyrhizobium lablabi]
MSLLTSPAQITGNEVEVVDLRSIDLSGVDRRRLQRSKLPARFAKDGITLSLEHLDVALAVRAEKEDARDDGIPCFKVSAKRLDQNSAIAKAAPVPEKSDDPVIQRLSDALAAAEAARDPHSAICADALRLAILTRQFSQADAGAGEASTGRNVRSLQKWRLKRVMQYIDERLGGKITLQDLAEVAGLSRMHFAAQFRAAMGMRPHEYLLKRRIERAEELLKRAEVSLVEIALTVGFQTQAHFTTVFKRFAGDTPYQWRSAYLTQSAPLPPARMSLS